MPKYFCRRCLLLPVLVLLSPQNDDGGAASATSPGTIGVAFVADEVSPCAPASTPYNNTVGAWRTANKHKRQLHYLAVVFSSNYTAGLDPCETVPVTLRVGAADFPSGAPWWDLAHPGKLDIRARRLNTSNSVHDIIFSDLKAAGGAAAGLLVDDDVAPTTVDKMTTAKGIAMAARSLDRYVPLNEAAFVAAPWGTDGYETVRYDVGAKELVLTTTMKPPSLLQITIAAGKARHK